MATAINTELLYSLLSSRLKELREEKDISQQEMSQHLSLSRASINNIEAGRQKPNLHTIMGYAELLDIDLKHIIPSINEVTKENLFLKKFPNLMYNGSLDDIDTESMREFFNKTQKKANNE
ncbi:helix-turn-helix transcriptional regulator [Nonlabens mediterrranea]|uniref:Helix-turn-helix transcriptional regulator n=1 Tax=Nonlabens mediterrranea TaxID=1419947 RepID=A0ABS0A1N5_9FLAO|nr:helix-turn-helix transcriptional regulator [Nonlabens mediterrranea]